ncbi:MAG: hypothetical protein EBZ49_00610 [Proteobacteria bacterium]|nr:hypothetical protein [Pseudomonadota bacterium]
MKPGDRADCPQCKSVAINITPLKNHDRSIAVYACQACGFAFKSDGGAFVSDSEKLKDVFRGATLGQKTLVESLGGENLNAATKALLTARLLEYGTQMWFDGLKQGLLLGAIKSEKDNGEVRD